MKRVLLVVNPVAGRGKAIAFAPKLLREFAARGIKANIIETTEKPENSLLDKAILDADTVIAMGGDGTLNRVARPILLTPTKSLPSVAFVALGTGNVAARAFHLPQRLSDIANLVAAGTARHIDAGIVFQNGIVAAVFLLWLGAGLDGAVIHAVADCRERLRGASLLPHYFLKGARTLMTYKFPKINVQSEQINGDFESAMIANVGLLGVGSITRFANPYDGQFNLIATPHRNRLSWCLSGIMALMHSYDFCLGVSRSRETNIKLHLQASVPVHVDGEPFSDFATPAGGVPSLEIQIRPLALPLLMPS